MDCLCLQTRQVARALTRVYEEHLRAADLTPAQFGLMSVLAMSSGISQSELAEKVDLDQTTLSRNLKTLAARKWIVTKQSREDRRQTAYRLSSAGHAAHAAALPLWKSAQRKMQRQLGKDWESSLALLKRLQQAAA